MKFRIGCVDGNTYESREFAREEVEQYINLVEGKIGTGSLKDRTYDFDEAIKSVTGMLEYDSSYDRQTFRMEMSKDISRTFNVCHIVWWELA